MSDGRVTSRLRAKLTAAFDPVRLVIEDRSARHAGHAGAPPGGESHFHITLVSAAFQGLSRIERQRRVNAVLQEELAGPVHALSLTLRTPDQ